MRDQQRANRKLRRFHRLRSIGVWCAFFCCLSPLSLVALATAHAETGNAVIVGVERLYVRRGPGAEFPPFATLTKGDTVEVQEMQGEWARIVTGGGQTGFVRSTFLVLPGEHKKPGAVASTPPSPTAKPASTTKPTPTMKPSPTANPGRPAKVTPVAAAEPETLRTANARSKSLEAEIQNLQQQIADLKSRRDAAPLPVAGTTSIAVALAPVTPASGTPVSGTPSPTPTQDPIAGSDQPQAEIARLTALVETLQHRLEVRPPIEGLPAPAVPSDGTPHSWSSGALTLGVIGIGIGFLAGSTLGKKPDRGRRSRVRF